MGNPSDNRELGPPPPFAEVTSEQARQLVDLDQVFAAYRETRARAETRFEGTMTWKRSSAGTYLVRRRRGRDNSLGPRSPATEATARAFHDGKRQVVDALAGLSARIDAMAPVNKALGIARVPLIVARILRRLDDAGLLGRAITIVGTHALFGYERKAGVLVRSEHLATRDIDLLFDARAQLELAIGDYRADGVIGLLQRVDTSFAVANRRFRAINRDGFMVDLIKPMARD